MLHNISKNNAIKIIFSQALESLLTEKNFKDITVSDILAKSGLSRSTFYRFFSDKYELATWPYREFVETKILGHPDVWNKSEALTSDMVNHLYENKDYYQKIASYSGQNSLFEEIRHIAKHADLIALQEKTGRKISEDNEFFVSLIAAGLAALINDWLLSGCLIPPEKFIHLLNQSNPIQKMFFTNE